MIPPSYCDIYLIRHGETDWNADGRLQGHTDIPLNDTGNIQALVLREKLASIPFTQAFSSDLVRARKTAEIVLESRGISITTTFRLRERHLGCWEGKPQKEYTEWRKKNSLDQLDHLAYLVCKGAGDIESYQEVFVRVQGLIEELAPSYLGKSLLLSSHGGVLRSILAHLNSEFGWKISNCGFLHLRSSALGELSLIAFEGVQKLSSEALL